MNKVCLLDAGPSAFLTAYSTEIKSFLFFLPPGGLKNLVGEFLRAFFYFQVTLEPDFKHHFRHLKLESHLLGFAKKIVP